MAKLGMHEAPAKDPEEEKPFIVEQYSPSKKEEKMVKRVKRLFSESKKHRENYSREWLEYYRFFRGKQWTDKRPSYRHSAVFNKVFRVIQSQVPILTDSRPTINFLPENPEDRPLANVLTKVFKADYDRGNWLMKIAEMIFDAHIYGTAYGKLKFNKEALQGLGAIEFDSEDPFYVFPDPEMREINDDRGNYLIIAEPMSLEKIRRKWKNGKYVKQDLIDLMGGSRTDLGEERYRTPTDNVDMVLAGDKHDPKQKEQALVMTCYYLNDFNEDGKPNKVVVSGNVLLESGDIETDDGRAPYAKLVNYLLPREFFGASEVEQIKGPQKIYNMIYSFVLDVLTLMGNPIWVVDNDSAVDTDNLFNRPGLIVEKSPGTEVRRETGVQLQPYVMNLLNLVRNEIDDESGSNDVSRGQQPGGVTAARAIEALQESSLTRLREKAKHIDAFLQSLGQLYGGLALNNYTAPRVIRLTNDAQTSQQYFKFSIEDSEEGKIARVRPAVELPDGSMQFSPEETTFKVVGNFDVKASTGSSLGFVKKEREERSIQLFQLGINDAEDVLNKLEWPDKDKILERVAQQQQAMMAAQAGVPGSTPPPAAPADGGTALPPEGPLQ